MPPEKRPLILYGRVARSETFAGEWPHGAEASPTGIAALPPRGIAVWSAVTPLNQRGSFTPATPPLSPPLRLHFAEAPPSTPHADALSTAAAGPCAECPGRCHAPRARASGRREMLGQ